MNHYPHHIGDFNNATRHLTRVERSLYSDLLDLYYDTERPLNSDFEKLARRVVAVSDDERAALQIVLDEFFLLADDGWHNARCDEEIGKYQSSVEQASRAGRASAAKRARGKSKVSEAKTPSAPANVVESVEQKSNDRSTTVQRPFNDRATNQNQNQNQNQYLTHTMPIQPQYPVEQAGPPDGGARAGPTMAGAVCVALRAAGVASCSPSSPALTALLDAGAPLDAFVAVASDIAQKTNKPGNAFAYILAVVKGQMADASAIAAVGGGGLAGRAGPPESFRERDERQARQKWEKLTGRTHPESPATPAGVVLDLATEPKRIEA